MKVNVTTPIKDFENKDLVDEKGNPIIYRSVITTALNTVLPKEDMLPEKKSKAFEICTKLYASKEVDLTVDQAALIKERVGEVYTPLVYGRICELLDGTEDK